MKKVRIELTHHELAVVRALLGKTNDSLDVGELFNKVADKADALHLDRIEVKVFKLEGEEVEWYAIGQ